MARSLLFLALLWAFSSAAAAPVGIAEAVALLLPVARELGIMVDILKMARALAAAGLMSVATALHAYASWRIRREQRRRDGGHQRHHQQAAPPRRARAPRARNRPYNQIDFEQDVLERLSALEFRRTFGLSRTAFDYLLARIEDEITDSPSAWGGVRSSTIMPPAVKLAMTLRWLRGGSYLDVAALYGCSLFVFYRTAYKVMEAICADREFILVPTIEKMHAEMAAGTFAYSMSENTLDALSTGFGRYTDYIINHCIGAIDGVQVKIKKPTVRVVPNPTTYMNRKGGSASRSW